MKNIFYHVSKVSINVGDYLICGRYGKRIEGNEFDAIHKYKELVFEQVRQRVASHAPSRLSSIFLFDEYNIACAYRLKQHKYLSYVYEVELDKNVKWFNVDHIWLDLKIDEVERINIASTLDEKLRISKKIYSERAIKYWSQDEATGTLTREVLAEGDVTIKRQLLKPFYV